MKRTTITKLTTVVKCLICEWRGQRRRRACVCRSEDTARCACACAWGYCPRCQKDGLDNRIYPAIDLKRWMQESLREISVRDSSDVSQIDTERRGRAIEFGNSCIPDAVWSRMVPEPNSGCWLWIPNCNAEGYGVILISGRYWYAHRLTYFIANGRVPDGRTRFLDHLCRTRCCCNPYHLEDVSPLQNVRRGAAGPRTQCPQGHPFDEANTYWRPDGGGRQCLTCSRSRALARVRRLRSGANI